MTNSNAKASNIFKMFSCMLCIGVEFGCLRIKQRRGEEKLSLQEITKSIDVH
jgi:hypothetical protein